jgi:hypothetical protein
MYEGNFEEQETNREEVKKASMGDESEVPDPATTGSSKRSADKDGGENTPMKQGNSPKTKVGMITAMVGKMHGMKSSEIKAAYDAVVGTSETSRPADKKGGEMNIVMQGNSKIKEALNPLEAGDIDIEDDIKALFSSDDSLSEEFKKKAATIFETAIITTVNEVLESISETIETTLEEESVSLREGMEEKLDNYLDYVVEEWMNENRVAIEGGLRTEIAEEFMGTIKNALEEHYIEVPENRVDVLEELSQKVESLEETVDKEIEKNIKLQEEIETYQKKFIFSEVSEDLSLTDTEKFRNLAANLNFINEDDYQDKLETLKESYFSEDEDDTESFIDDEEPLQEEIKESYVDPAMNAYVRNLSRFAGSNKKTTSKE